MNKVLRHARRANSLTLVFSFVILYSNNDESF